MTKQTSARERATQRRDAVWQFYLAGLSSRRIAQRLDVSHMTVQRDIRAILKRQKDELMRTAMEYQALEEERLDLALQAIWPGVIRGDHKAIDALIRNHRARCRLHGL